MFLLTSIVMLIIYCISQLGAAIGASYESRNKKELSEYVFKWAREHEDEWIDGTDLIARENGKLMYYPNGYNEFTPHEVTYGWDLNHYQYGLVYAGRVVFNYEQVWWAKATLEANPNRVQYIDGKPLLNLGIKRGLNGDIYKVIGEDKYYCYGKEVWMIDKGTCICRFTDDKMYNPEFRKRREALWERAWR